MTSDDQAKLSWLAGFPQEPGSSWNKPGRPCGTVVQPGRSRQRTMPCQPVVNAWLRLPRWGPGASGVAPPSNTPRYCHPTAQTTRGGGPGSQSSAFVRGTLSQPRTSARRRRSLGGGGSRLAGRAGPPTRLPRWGPRGASPVSVRRQTLTTGCYAAKRFSRQDLLSTRPAQGFANPWIMWQRDCSSDGALNIIMATRDQLGDRRAYVRFNSAGQFWASLDRVE